MNILNDTEIKGQITGRSIVKSGGTGMQVLMADGNTKELSEMYCYGICSTAASTQAKTVSMSGFVLKTYCKVCVKFTYANTASSPTLNVNGTGAKTIRYNNSNISSGQIKANHTYEFIYDGTYWQLVGDLDTNTDTKVTSVGNHYSPSANANSKLSANNGNYISAIQRDAKGHVTEIETSAINNFKVLDNQAKYDSASEYILNNGDDIGTLINRGNTHFEISYKNMTRDIFAYLTPAASEDFASSVELFLQKIMQNSPYDSAEYKLHFSVLSPNQGDIKTINMSHITSYTLQNGVITAGMLSLSNMISLGLSRTGFEIEVVVNKIKEIAFVHYNITALNT